jgi:hypothetical protein
MGRRASEKKNHKSIIGFQLFIICLLSSTFEIDLFRVGTSAFLTLFFLSLALQSPWALASAFLFHDHFTDGRTTWTSDQLVARPLPKHRTTQTQNKHVHTPNIYALCGIRTQDPSFRASEGSTCLRLLGYRDRPNAIYFHKLSVILQLFKSCSRYLQNILSDFSASQVIYVIHVLVRSAGLQPFKGYLRYILSQTFRWTSVVHNATDLLKAFPGNGLVNMKQCLSGRMLLLVAPIKSLARSHVSCFVCGP